MKISLCIFVVLFLCSCKEKPATSQKPLQKDTANYFQVAQFLQSQVNEVNKTPYYIYRLDITASTKDSTPIDNAAFNRLAAQFMQPDINDSKLKPYYNENVFHDQTTKSLTISYATQNKDLVIQNVDVLINEDGKTVKRVFIRKFYNYPDSAVIEQLSWKSGRSFQINRLIQKPGEKEKTHQIIVVWNGE